MSTASFFKRGPGLSLRELAEMCNGELVGPAGSEELVVHSIAALEDAGPQDVGFFDRASYADRLQTARAGCIIAPQRMRSKISSPCPLLFVKDVQASFALAGRALFPDALAPSSSYPSGVSPKADVHPAARLEDGVTVEAFAVIGPDVEIGAGTIVSAGATIARGCRIGRDCRIGPNVSVQHALLGNRVILHPGVAIGQDGFGYAAGASGIVKMVQIGRVILQDDVEVGANTTIDRGAVRDTVVGENTKIDNQVQIGHNVQIGRNCLIVSQVGIAGSATIEDGVAIGGQTGVNGHVRIGRGAQIAAVSSVAGDVPPGARWGGTPAHSVRDWFREVTWVRESAKRSSGKTDGSRDDEA